MQRRSKPVMRTGSERAVPPFRLIGEESGLSELFAPRRAVSTLADVEVHLARALRVELVLGFELRMRACGILLQWRLGQWADARR